MRMSGLAIAALAACIVAGLAAPGAEGRARTAPRSVRLAATESGDAAMGRVSFRSRRGTTYLSARFSRLAPDTSYRMTWDADGESGVPFMTDFRGRARIRRVEVSGDAAVEGTDVSVTDESGDPVLACDAGSMPGMHDGEGGMMGNHEGACTQACMDHCTNGGTCDEACHRDHGCTDATCCCGSGGDGGGHGCGGMSGGAESDHDSHHADGGMMDGMHGSSGGGGMHR